VGSGLLNIPNMKMNEQDEDFVLSIIENIRMMYRIIV